MYLDITNASRGTVNARHFWCAVIFVVNLVCVKLVCALPAP
ncbi:DUF3265 domain-containing protein [Vibrio cholerae]|uniref:DUF3265 domain-containing protein n=1 Tax=Vibrio cholerae TaxID=666 RepID=A0A5C9T1P0_VIBCL|nr:DUF3265 domain-containing protein [Vibrio cholerae]NAO59076.1 DUF3265 domain-containing protein [Vibrio cholerae]TVM57486.1 DUF3265 domain-containing protein [Vibrio cholerae]TVN05052.1 DUF3265 domain-containing protein [Vibrio cholerae]TXY93432.1 DUF3265 domain-containing protein [Vibrio cholerae]